MAYNDHRMNTRLAIHRAIADARAVFFDFDFTLADSSTGVVVCMNHALSCLGLPPASEDAIRRTIGLDLITVLGILAGDEWKPRGREFLAHFTRKADEVMVASTVFLPGAGRVLRTLHGAGYRLGVVSTKYRRRVEEALERDAGCSGLWMWSWAATTCPGPNRLRTGCCERRAR